MSDTRKVHVAGKPEGLIQRCTRCRSKIKGAPWRPGSYWETGALVSSHRGGMRVVTEEEAAQIRKCGRSK